MWVTSSLDTALTPTTVALGNFDGVHRGHRQVIQPALTAAASRSDGKRGYATVVTFNPHPQEFFTGQPRQLLTPLNEKVAQFAQIGVEQLVLLPFDRELASLSPFAFVSEILVRQLWATCISVGADFCFGRQRMGTAQDLQTIAAQFGVDVAIVPLERISAIASAVQPFGKRFSKATCKPSIIC